jgi:hypothetical protein
MNIQTTVHKLKGGKFTFDWNKEDKLLKKSQHKKNYSHYVSDTSVYKLFKGKSKKTVVKKHTASVAKLGKKQKSIFKDYPTKKSKTYHEQIPKTSLDIFK